MNATSSRLPYPLICSTSLPASYPSPPPLDLFSLCVDPKGFPHRSSFLDVFWCLGTNLIVFSFLDHKFRRCISLPVTLTVLRAVIGFAAMALVESRVCSHSGSIHSTHSAHWSTSASHLPLYNARTSHPASSAEALEQLSASFQSVDLLELDDLGRHDNSTSPCPARHKYRARKQTPPSLTAPRSSDDARQQPVNLSARARNSDEKRSFHRWMRSIRRRAMLRSSVQGTAGSGLVQNGISNEPHQEKLLHPHRHRKMSSDSSLAFVTAVRSASVSLASMSALARSKRAHTRSIARSRTERSSRTSFAGTRISEDSAIQELSVLSDMASLQRAAQRRRVLEELVSTEESYIGDLRFLMNVRLY
jgi:hypothetical protein